jgi:hypothetical protein
MVIELRRHEAEEATINTFDPGLASSSRAAIQNGSSLNLTNGVEGAGTNFPSN